jgi:hypothetical protein
MRNSVQLRSAYISSLQSDLLRATCLLSDVETRDAEVAEFFASLERTAAYYKNALEQNTMRGRALRRTVDFYTICKVFIVYSRVFMQSIGGSTDEYNEILRSIVFNGADARLCDAEFIQQFDL